MNLDVLVRVAANGFILIISFGAILNCDVFALSLSDLSLASLIVGILTEPFLIHFHPFKARPVVFYRHLKTIVAAQLSTPAFRATQNQKLENAYLKALWEYTLRMHKDAERFATVVSKQTRLALFYVLTEMILRIAPAITLLAIAAKLLVLGPLSAAVPVAVRSYVRDNLLLGISSPIQVVSVGLAMFTGCLLLRRQYTNFAALQYLVEFDYLDTYLTMNREVLIQNAKQMADDPELLRILAMKAGYDFIAFVKEVAQQTSKP